MSTGPHAHDTYEHRLKCPFVVVISLGIFLFSDPFQGILTAAANAQKAFVIEQQQQSQYPGKTSVQKMFVKLEESLDQCNKFPFKIRLKSILCSHY